MCDRPVYVCQPLERRVLLAGITIVTHGFNSAATSGTWPDLMGDAIAERLGGQAAVSQYTLTITGSSSQPTAFSLTHDAGTPAWDPGGDAGNPSGEVLIKLDWSQISSSFGVSAQEVGDFAANTLLNGALGTRSFLEVPIHLVGHSRGGSLISQLAKKLGEAGLWVEQLTTLDPHPSSFFSDAPIQIWQNVAYADNFWRGANGNPFDFPGQSVSGADNYGPLSLPGGSSLDHSDVHAYYHGTIDRDATSNGAGGPIVDGWYGGNANRATAGFNRSRIGRGAVVNGVGNNFGGPSSRAALAITSPQWYSNVGFLDLNGGTTGAFATGDPVTLSYRYQAVHAAQPTNVSFFIDANTNPYDAGAIALGSQTVTPAGTSNPATTFGFAWPALPAGLYRVYARITNPDGRTRYAYNNEPLVTTDTGGEIITKQWAGDVSSDWSDPRNWTPGGVTSGNDRAAIQISSTAQVNLAGSANAAAIHVLSGGLIVSSDASGPAVNIGPSGYGVLNATQHLSSLKLTGNAAATLSAGGNKALVVQSLTVSPTATLDLTDNDLIVDYTGVSPIADVEADVRSGYNITGDWLGKGVTSSTAASDGNFTLAVADNPSLAAPFGAAQGGPLFAGVDVDLTSVLVKFTHRADLNLDGVITPDDSAIFGGNYDENQPARWSTGDLNYDGLFTPDDAALFGGAYDEFLPQI